MGSWAVAPIFWSVPSTLLTGAAAAGGIALINSVGQLGGWVGPWIFGLVKDATGSDSIALFSLAMGPIISSILLVVEGTTAGWYALRHAHRKRRGRSLPVAHAAHL